MYSPYGKTLITSYEQVNDENPLPISDEEDAIPNYFTSKSTVAAESENRKPEKLELDHENREEI